MPDPTLPEPAPDAPAVPRGRAVLFVTITAPDPAHAVRWAGHIRDLIEAEFGGSMRLHTALELDTPGNPLNIPDGWPDDTDVTGPEFDRMWAEGEPVQLDEPPAAHRYRDQVSAPLRAETAAALRARLAAGDPPVRKVRPAREPGPLLLPRDLVQALHDTTTRLLHAADTPNNTGLRRAIDHTLRTTTSTTARTHPGPEEWREHGASHRYSATCALCTGDVDALTAAVLGVVLPRLAQAAADLKQERAARQEAEEEWLEAADHADTTCEAAAAINRVRKLHRVRNHNGCTICGYCSDYDPSSAAPNDAPVPYPCDTIRALDGTGQPTDTHHGTSPYGIPETHKGPRATCPGPDCGPSADEEN